MANVNTTIEWTDKTWSPITGCTKVSPGCLNCYAETIAKRFQHDGPFVPWTVAAQRAARPQEGVPTGLGYQPITLHADRMNAPLHWRKPSRVFVNSVSDLFHEDVPEQFIAQCFGVMLSCPQHTFQVLTKRPERMQAFMTGYWADHFKDVSGFGVWPPPNVWLGVSVENQRYANERIPILAQVPAAVRFLSCEPLLGPVNLGSWIRHYPGGPAPISWCICGGESGPHARPMDLAWARGIVAQCREAGVACFVKQLGAHPYDAMPLFDWTGQATGNVRQDDWLMKSGKGGDMSEWPEDLRIRQFPQEAKL